MGGFETERGRGRERGSLDYLNAQGILAPGERSSLGLLLAWQALRALAKKYFHRRSSSGSRDATWNEIGEDSCRARGVIIAFKIRVGKAGLLGCRTKGAGVGGGELKHRSYFAPENRGWHWRKCRWHEASDLVKLHRVAVFCRTENEWSVQIGSFWKLSTRLCDTVICSE